MSRQIFLVILIVCLVIFGAVWYTHRSRARAVNSGEVFVRDQATDAAKANGSSPASTSSDQTASTEQSAQTQESVAATVADGSVSAPPATDSIPRIPPNGMVFAGTGKYQLYRQGDITWRLNTDTGQSCILFATDREWRNPRVFQHGCGS
jgi:cytoskeletal protein RodZ